MISADYDDGRIHTESTPPPTTEILLLAGERLHVEGDCTRVEASILDAARGSLMELVWLKDAHTGQAIALNPEHVVMLRALDPQ